MHSISFKIKYILFNIEIIPFVKFTDQDSLPNYA